MKLNAAAQRKAGLGLLLCFILALCLPFLQMRILSADSQFMGWQIWLISFYVLSSDGALWRHFLFPLLSTASLLSLLLVVGLMLQRWRWIYHRFWRGFALLICVAYSIAPFALTDPARYLVAYYVGLIFHFSLLLVLFNLSAEKQ